MRRLLSVRVQIINFMTKRDAPWAIAGVTVNLLPVDIPVIQGILFARARACARRNYRTFGFPKTTPEESDSSQTPTQIGIKSHILGGK